MNFIERITGLISSPDKTMADIAKEPRIEEALVVVAAYAIFSGIAAYLSATHITYVYPEGTPNMGALTTIVSLISGLIMPFIGWLIATVVLYLFAMVFGGDGKFTTVLTAIGFSSLVKIFALIIGILLLTQAPNITLTIDPSNPLSSLSDMSSYTRNPFVLASSLVGLLGLLWSCFIGVFAIKHTEKLSMTSAAIVVGVPTLLYIVLQYGSILLSII